MAPFFTFDNTIPVVFSTAGFRGNTITLYGPTWNDKIVIGHPEMAGLEDYVQSAIIDPDEIRPSTRFADSFGFKYSSPELVDALAGVGSTATEIRVLVYTTDPNNFMVGGTSSLITTAYPIDLSAYTPRLGPPIFTKKKTGP
jgi:hypothetical protein